MTTSWSLGTSWVLFLLCLKSVAPQDGDGPLEVITESSPCSATCGLGVRSQTLCRLKDAQTALKEDARGTSRSEVTQQCRRRTVQCLVSWHCGLRTLTAAEGQSLRIDCVDEVVEQLGSFSWRVSWRYARGVITTDDSLFARRQVPQLGHVLLDPVREEDAGMSVAPAQSEGSEAWVTCAFIRCSRWTVALTRYPRLLLFWFDIFGAVPLTALRTVLPLAQRSASVCSFSRRSA